MATIRDKFIQKIKEDFELLSVIVLRQTDNIITLSENNKNPELYDTINENEKIIDGLEIKIRDEVINSIVLYSPRASDSRKIISYHDMTAYLERIGDLLLNIADFLGEINVDGPLYIAYQKTIQAQLHTVKSMTQNAIFAFTCEDEDLAKNIIAQDDTVDNTHKEIIHGIPGHLCGEIMDKQDILDALSISNMSYNIERIGDNATNIAEAAIYLMEGKNAKHIHNEKE